MGPSLILSCSSWISISLIEDFPLESSLAWGWTLSLYRWLHCCYQYYMVRHMIWSVESTMFSSLVPQRLCGPTWCHLWFHGSESYLSSRGGTRVRREVPWMSMLKKLNIYTSHVLFGSSYFWPWLEPLAHGASEGILGRSDKYLYQGSVNFSQDELMLFSGHKVPVITQGYWYLWGMVPITGDLDVGLQCSQFVCWLVSFALMQWNTGETANFMKNN